MNRIVNGLCNNSAYHIDLPAKDLKNKTKLNALHRGLILQVPNINTIHEYHRHKTCIKYIYTYEIFTAYKQLMFVQKLRVQ